MDQRADDSGIEQTMRSTICFQPIGVIHSDHQQAQGTPIQPRFAEAYRGYVDLDPEYLDALADLDGFERIWLFYHFDRATQWKAKVIPFRDTVERGLFATRAPKRPNGIGISCVRLEGIQGNRLILSEVDILDQTPLLDIKPYVPMFDAYPEARAGWLDQRQPKGRNEADDRFHEKS